MKILPDEIPDDAAPLETVPVDFNNTVSPFSPLVHGENVFVTMLDGQFYVGRCEFGKTPKHLHRWQQSCLAAQHGGDRSHRMKIEKETINTIGMWLVILACVVAAIIFGYKGDKDLAHGFGFGAGIFWFWNKMFS